MASPSPWRWPWKSTTDSSIKSSYHSSSSFSSSIIYPFIIFRGKRTRLTSFSSGSSSSSTSCSCSASLNNARKRSSKSQKPITVEHGDLENTRSKPRRRRALTFKSLFAKRSLWRRILFASRKVRSIILLNVITLIYGKILSSPLISFHFICVFHFFFPFLFFRMHRNCDGYRLCFSFLLSDVV